MGYFLFGTENPKCNVFTFDNILTHLCSGFISKIHLSKYFFKEKKNPIINTTRNIYSFFVKLLDCAFHILSYLC